MSLISLLREQVERDPDAVMLVDAHPDRPVEVTRGAFWRRVGALRDDLAAHGVGPGGCVAVWLPNWSDALAWQFAAAASGAHVIGINTRYNIEEAAHVLDMARPAVVAVAHGFLKLDLGERLAAAAAASGAPRPSVAVSTGPHRAPASAEERAPYDLGAGTWSPGETADGAPPAEGLADGPDRIAVAFTTSGSTGKPKLAAHTVAAVARHARAAASAGAWTRGSVTVVALPLSGVFSFVPAMATIAAGGVCLLEPSFDPAAIVADMERYRATHLVGADDIVGRLVEAAKQRPGALSSLSRLLMADFNGRSEELSRWAEISLGTLAAGVYGSSELFALTAIWPGDEPTPRRWRGGGRPVSPDIEVRAGDPETGEALAPGQTGELQFRGYNVVDAYLGEPGRRRTVLTADGWFRSGDLGSVAADGSFDYLCRNGDALRLKGFLVEPAEIENRLAAHEAVALTKVVGIRGRDGETEAVAFAVLREGRLVEPAALLAWCAGTLARYKVPQAVHLIERMPVTSGVNGTKVRAATLREWAASLAQDPKFVIPRSPEITAL